MAEAETSFRPRREIQSLVGLLILCWWICAPAFAQGEEACGDLRRAIVLDYRTATPAQKANVESVHFTADVESLRRGATGTLGADLSFTLLAFPNHPRALLAMMKLGERAKTETPRGARYSVACYFDRAARFAPDDGTVRVLYGIYLSKKGDKNEALKQLEAASKLVGNDPNLHYNLGLAYFDLKDYDRALLHAQQAYKLGFPLPGLRDKLKKAGKWRDR
jgi:tetratricopeptide (TPR) repeat protein